MTPFSTATPKRHMDGPERILLAQYLRDELAAQKELQGVLKGQQAALVAQNPPAMAKCLADASPLLAKLEELGRRRSQAFSSLAQRLGIPVSSCRLSDLVSRAKDDQVIQQLARELRVIVERVGLDNRRNAALVRTTLATQRALVNALLGAEDQPCLYDRTARHQDNASVKPVLDKEL